MQAQSNEVINGAQMQSNSTTSREQAVNTVWLAVKEFHAAFDLPLATEPRLLAMDRLRVRSTWMREELNELEAAASIAEQADALVDLLYLLVGTLVEMGLAPGKVFELVHDANMRKRWPDGIGRTDDKGKVLKPPGWISPDPAIDAYVQEVSLERRS